MALRLPIALALTLTAGTVFAVDIINTDIPSPIPDGRLSIGNKVLLLPEGDWALVGSTKGSAGLVGGGGPRSDETAAIAMKASPGKGFAAVVLDGLHGKIAGTRWMKTQCDNTTTMHFELVDSNPVRPACLQVSRGTFISTGSKYAPYRQAAEWAAKQQIPVSAQQYNITFARYIAGDYVIVRTFLPRSTFSSDAEAIAWGREMAGAVRTLVENETLQLPSWTSANAATR